MPPRTHAAIESLETRAMLAGVGPESWSAPGIAPAPLGTGALFSSGVILTCSSPTPGSSGTASPPAPTSGSGGSTAGGDLWLAFSAGSGAGGSTSGSTGGVSTDGPALSSQYTGGSGIGRITPLVYNPESDGAPVFHSGVFTGDHGSVQFVQTGDTGNQGTGEGDGSQSDDKSRARSWWGIRGWFLGDEPIDEGGSQVVPTSESGNAHDDGAPDGEPRGNPSPLRLPRNTGWSQFTSMGEPGWGDDVPVIRPGDVEAARGLTGLAKMIYDHGPPVSSRSADSNGRVIVYTFADGSSYMEPVEPPSEQYIDSAAAMIPGGIALSRGKGVLVASGAVAADLVEDAVTNRAREAADDATGGRLAGIPDPILAILLGARPKAKPGVVDDAAAGAKNAGTTAAKGADDVAAGGATGIAPSRLPAISPPTNRRGLRQAMDSHPADMVNPNAHHDLPWTFRDWFAQRGLDVNDPRFGRWVEGNPPGTHQSWTNTFESEWRQFIERFPNATTDDVLRFMKQQRIDPRFQ